MDDRKKCSICQKLKSKNEFVKDKYCKDGFTRQCKKCKREKYRQHYYFGGGKETRKQYGHQYNKSNRKILREKLRKWRRKNREKVRASDRRWYQKNKIKISTKERERRQRNSRAWLIHFSKYPKCEICNKSISYFSGTGNKGVFFDHPKNDLPIRINPSTWLVNNFPSSENKLIWDSCNFGILCNRCNGKIPTNNRKEWLKKVTEYIERRG